MRLLTLCGAVGYLLLSTNQSEAAVSVFQKRHVEYAAPNVQLHYGRDYYVPVQRFHRPRFVRCPQTGRWTRFNRRYGWRDDYYYHPSYHRPRFRVRYY